MVRLRRLDKVVAQSLLQLVIGLRLPLVLTLMFCPRTHQECLHIAIPVLPCHERFPIGSTIAAPYAIILVDRFNKLRLSFWNYGVFNRNQHRSSLKIGYQSSLTTIGIRQWFHGLRSAVDSGSFAKRTNTTVAMVPTPAETRAVPIACSLGDCAPSGAAKCEASLIYQNEDRQELALVPNPAPGSGPGR